MLFAANELFQSNKKIPKILKSITKSKRIIGNNIVDKINGTSSVSNMKTLEEKTWKQLRNL
jgi:hypothetical protein